MPEHRTKYQEKIIRNYYENRDNIALQKSQELVTELYLNEGKKREKIWDRLVGHLKNLGLKDEQVEHLRKQDDPAVVAQVITKYA